MWLFIAPRNVVASRMPLTQLGICACQTSVCPRNRWFWLRALLAMRSAELKVKVLRDGSVASHFISFSAVTELNSRLRIVVYCESPSLPAATAAPKYRPDWAAAAPRVVAASAALGTSVTALVMASERTAERSKGRRHRSERSCRVMV